MEIRKIKIKSITPAKNEDVYDLTVNDNHNFVGNSIVVHNCGKFRCAQMTHADLWL